MYMILNYISLPIFLISFCLGLFFAYVLGADTKIIYVYPTPENIDKILFKDNADNCFSFEQIQTKCPLNASEISEIPIQL